MAAADPLVRINFFNGLRLDATALATEQNYHIEVRRRLTQALFTPGIATGLEVRKSEMSDYSITISEGVAVDNVGRAIILTEPQEVIVQGMPSPAAGVFLGNFVAIAYDERRTAPMLGPCTPIGATSLERGAPSRIVLAPRILFRDSWPSNSEGLVILAQIELLGDCRVGRINTAVRRYVAAARPPKTRAMALEGEKDLDSQNPKILRFHIEGDYPASATLYLQADRFSSLYYTELGRHSHGVDLSTHEQSLQLQHTHTVEVGETDEAGTHTHSVLVDVNDNDPVLDRVNANAEDRGFVPSFINDAGRHSHTILNLQLADALADATFTSPVTGATDETGATGNAARAGAALSFVDAMTIHFDGQDVTEAVRFYLAGRDGAAVWQALGDGTQNHRLVQQGTLGIDLIQLGLDLSQGPHDFRFAVPAGNGGKIFWNLYIE